MKCILSVTDDPRIYQKEKLDGSGSRYMPKQAYVFIDINMNLEKVNRDAG
jgi:hypothetical protein